MILPTKHLPPSVCLLAAGAEVYVALQRPRTITQAYEAVRQQPALSTFDRFVLAVDLLYIMGLVTFDQGRLVRARQ